MSKRWWCFIGKNFRWGKYIDNTKLCLIVLIYMVWITWHLSPFIMKTLYIYMYFFFFYRFSCCNLLTNVRNTHSWSLIICHLKSVFLISFHSILLLTVWKTDNSNLCIEVCAGCHVITSEMGEACLFAVCLYEFWTHKFFALCVCFLSIYPHCPAC